MEALTRLKKTSTVAAYEAQFEGVSNRLKGLFEKQTLSCFLSSLKDETRLHIRLLDPISLSAAFGLAKIQEEYVWSTRKTLKGVVGVTDSQIIVEGMGMGNQRNSFQARKVSSAQMDEKRRKDLCYHCEEKWNASHVCKNPKIYLLQVENSEASDGEVEKEQEVVGESKLTESDEQMGSLEIRFMPYQAPLILIL